MEELIKQLIDEGYLKTPEIIEAFRKIKRRDFLPADLKPEAAINAPLPIGAGQTISQPLTVAFMLELLKPEAGQKILDIGFGSGWTTALLGYIVSKDNAGGKVFAVERVSALAEFGKNNIFRYNFIKSGIVKVFCADGSKGLKTEAPFDGILVSAAAEEVPKVLKDQLKISGRLVIPTQAQDIRLIERVEENRFKEMIYPGFVFVPLITDNN